MRAKTVMHTGCKHPDTKYEREKCRTIRPHAECEHEQTTTAARACVDMKKSHQGCSHDPSFSERTACLNERRKAQ